MSRFKGQSDAQRDSSSLDAHVDDDKERLLSFESIKTSKKFNLGVDGAYTDWNSREAFRELIQNWRDGIIESNGLAPMDFYVHREAKGEANGEAVPPNGDTEIVYKAFRRDVKDSAECLGFVRYKGLDGQGTIEITNLRAALQTKHLCLGTTTKKHREDQAGAHGEGLNVAAITLMREDQNHNLSCRTTGCKLSFNFDRDGYLYVWARHIKLDKTAQPKLKKFVIPTPTANANDDVQFIIGESGEGRNEFGELGDRRLVQQEDFKRWTKVALFFNEVEGGDASIVSTVHGDLLISADQRGKLYLKELLISESTQFHSGSVTRRPLGFGYNFASGRTDRDRRSLVDDESEAICKILSEALKVRPDQVAKVCDLLNSNEHRYAEGECNVRSWPSSTALLFKQHLLRGEFANRWLYTSGEMRKAPSLLRIIKGMGRQPFHLSDKLWAILNCKRLVNTAEKEAQRFYKKAPTVPVPETTFATSLNHLLEACMHACPQLEMMGMKLEFVDAGPTHLNLFALEKAQGWFVRVHKRWLSMDTAVTKLGLVGNVVEARAAVFAAKKLFSDVVRNVPIEIFLQEGSLELPEDHIEQQVQRAEQRLENYQMMHVGIVDKAHHGHLGLTVGWTVNDGQQDDLANIEVQCHRVSRCSHLRDRLLIGKDVEARTMACITQVQPGNFDGPPCRVHRTNRHRGTMCESGLEEGEEYFFVLATPVDQHSFVRVSEAKRVVAGAEAPANGSIPGQDNDSFSLGPRVEAHELLEQALASDRWYNAENSHGVHAVIGFVKGEKSHPAESRKRPRTD